MTICLRGFSHCSVLKWHKKRKTKTFTSASSSGTGSSLLLCMFWKRCRRGSRGALVPWVERSLSISLVPLSHSRSSSRTADSSWLERHREKIIAFQLQEDISIGKSAKIISIWLPESAPLYSQLQQDGQGQVLVLERNVAFGAGTSMYITEDQEKDYPTHLTTKPVMMTMLSAYEPFLILFTCHYGRHWSFWLTSKFPVVFRSNFC